MSFEWRNMRIKPAHGQECFCRIKTPILGKIYWMDLTYFTCNKDKNGEEHFERFWGFNKNDGYYPVTGVEAWSTTNKNMGE